ncbi:MAG: phosphoribosylamine--glycine ligase, partial [Gammaproteobacteria bacterium]|nr:phosphoribosylamine--glycine ligase [Gammaproteobacteria bacterium]
MKVLVTGGGGREHALAWRIAQSSAVEKVFVAPGNAGTELEEKLHNVSISPMDFDALIEFAQTEKIDLTVVGPEDPLVAGCVDRFAEAGLRCFGPSKSAAQLEGSKSFTKAFLKKYGIPTGDYRAFDEIEAADEYLDTQIPPIVIKADGLAAGKGVVIAQSIREAKSTVADMLSGNVLSGAGSRVVIEEFLEGEEASFIIIADGENFLPFATSQDHKAAYDGDTGPNTGGMGAYSPAPVV